MLKLKFQYFGHLMRRADSLEKTLMLGKIEHRRRRGWQRMRRLDSITDSMDMNVSKRWETVEDRGARRAAISGVTESQTRLSEWTTTADEWGCVLTQVGVGGGFQHGHLQAVGGVRSCCCPAHVGTPGACRAKHSRPSSSQCPTPRPESLSWGSELSLLWGNLCLGSVTQPCPTLVAIDCSPAGLLCPWNSPGKDTGAGCYFLLQGIFPTQVWNLCLLRLLTWQVDSLPLCATSGSPSAL